MDSLLLLYEVLQGADVVFFPGVGPCVVLWHVALVSGDMEAVLALRGVANAVLMHFRKESAKFGGVWDTHCHVDESADEKVAVSIRGASAKCYGNREAVGREGM